MPYLSVPGDRLFYALFEGDLHHRKNLILIHGAGGNHRHWPAELRRFPGYRVSSLDLPGHGLSSGCGRTAIAEYAYSVESFVRAQNLSEVVVIGHSMGGAIALTLALQDPSWLSAVVVIACGPRLPIEFHILEGLRPGSQSGAMRERTIQQICQLAYGPDADPQLRQRGCQELLNVDPAVLYGDYLACSRFDVTDRLNRIRIPILFLTAAQDRLLPAAVSAESAEQIPKAQTVEIPHAGHMVVLEKAQQTAGIVEMFLDRLAHSEP